MPASKTKSKKISRTRTNANLKKLPKVKNFKIWVGVLIIIIIAVVGVVVVRLSNAAGPGGITTLRPSNCPGSNRSSITIQVEGFKPVSQDVCKVDNRGVNLTLPRAVKSGEKICFWGKSAFNTVERLDETGYTAGLVNVDYYGVSKPNPVGIISCFKNVSNGNLPSMELRSNGIIYLTNVSYGY